MPRNLNKRQRKEWVLKQMTSSEGYKARYGQTVGKTLPTPKAIKTATGTVLPYGLSIMMGILQGVAFKSLWNDEKAQAAGSTQYKWRIAAGGMAMAGGIAETAEMLFQQIGPKSAARATSFASYAKVAGHIGRGLGVAAGVITGVWDIVDGGNEVFKGNTLLGWGKVVIGALGLVSTVLFYLSFILLGFAIVAVIIIASIAMSYFKDNAIQNWLERTWHGILTSDQYQNNGIEQLEFARTINGMKG